MKRIALVHPRYGLEISGGSETYARKIAEHLANRYEVEVLTTKQWTVPHGKTGMCGTWR